MIKYIGSKRRVVPELVDWIGQLPGVRRVGDLFSGSARVAHALKAAGYAVEANDHNDYAATLARGLVQADRERWQGPAERLIAELDRLPPQAGWFTEQYCERSRYFQAHNGARIDAVRERIDGLDLEPELEAIALTSLLLAADKVDSTAGVQMAYLKGWSKRSHRELRLEVPPLLPRAAHGDCRARGLDALDAARVADVDLLYLDPPYNQHPYLSNYHLWETLVRWDRPEVYGVARKRVDCRERKSRFNFRARAADALAELLSACDAPYLLLSYSNEAFLRRPQLRAMLAERGHVQHVELELTRYIGARIGVHSPAGVRTGRVSHTTATESLWLVSPEPVTSAAMAAPRT